VISHQFTYIIRTATLRQVIMHEIYLSNAVTTVRNRLNLGVHSVMRHLLVVKLMSLMIHIVKVIIYIAWNELVEVYHLL